MVALEDVHPGGAVASREPRSLRHFVSPLVRRMARESDVDVAAFSGTGRDGRVRKLDVLAAMSARGAPSSRSPRAGDESPQGHRLASYLSPLVRQLVNAHDLDVDTISGTGRDGRVRKVDVLDVLEARPDVQGSAQVADHPANLPIPLSMCVEVDLTLLDPRGQGQQRLEEAPARRMAAFAWAVTRAQKAPSRVPPPRGHGAGARQDEADQSLGLTVDSPRGPLVAMILGADELSFRGLLHVISGILERPSGVIAVEPFTSLTLTDSSSRGVLNETTVLQPGEVANLSLGAVVRRPVVVEDAEGEGIAVRSMAYLTMTYDQRVVDAAQAAAFIGSVRDLLQGFRP